MGGSEGCARLVVSGGPDSGDAGSDMLSSFPNKRQPMTDCDCEPGAGASVRVSWEMRAAGMQLESGAGATSVRVSWAGVQHLPQASCSFICGSGWAGTDESTNSMGGHGNAALNKGSTSSVLW